MNKMGKIDELEKNIEILKQSYLRLKTENEELFIQKQNLLQEIKEKNKEIENLKKQLEDLKISNALVFGANKINAENLQDIKHEAKIKLNQIIKEIETAIKILTVNNI